MATPTSLQRLVRRALLQIAKADAGLIALVPASSIDPEGEPTWPFLFLDAPTTRRLRASCVNGALVTWDAHVFAGPKLVSGAITETGYDRASAIGSRLETVWADNRITLDGGAEAKIEFSDGNMLRDGTPDKWHWFAQINARVLAA